MIRRMHLPCIFLFLNVKYFSVNDFFFYTHNTPTKETGMLLYFHFVDGKTEVQTRILIC